MAKEIKFGAEARAALLPEQAFFMYQILLSIYAQIHNSSHYLKR